MEKTDIREAKRAARRLEIAAKFLRSGEEHDDRDRLRIAFEELTAAIARRYSATAYDDCLEAAARIQPTIPANYRYWGTTLFDPENPVSLRLDVQPAMRESSGAR